MSEGEGSSVNVKVWIGNIDTKLDEYQLLKIVEKERLKNNYVDLKWKLWY